MGEWRTVARVGAVQPGRAISVIADGKRIALCNLDGEHYAIDDLCTHDYESLGAGELVDDQIECPRHGALFDVKTGKATALPAIYPVGTYPVRIEGNEIQVDIG